MSAFADYSREQLRKAYADAWAKVRAKAPLTPLESMIADVVALHPEYQATVAALDDALAHESAAGGSTENPFLHMGLHIAVREQLSIDRPPGVREIHGRAVAKYGDGHAAEHLLMEALGRTLWEAQRNGTAPDERRYLTLARETLNR